MLDNVDTGGYIGLMNEVGIRELKNRLSEYVRLVRAGEVFMVTDRGEVVAELCPPGQAAGKASRYPGLQALVRRGAVSLGEGNDAALYELLPPVAPAGLAGRLLAEERGER
jgi:prevent-host-death family protein